MNFFTYISSGSGKSALVNELRKPVLRQHGHLLSGKFDQYKPDIPYATIAQALHGWVTDILASSDDEIAAWRARLRTALGARGQLVIDVIPALQALIGPQPALPELAQNETQQRFTATFGQFLGAVCRAQPVVLFLDDLQWADAASLALIASFATDADNRNLLMIGAYRDNEVPPGHPLLDALTSIRSAGVPVHDVALEPLGIQHLAELVADTVHCTPSMARPLAALVLEKTGGNAFFALQFLMSLHREGLIAFDPERRLWRWDVDKIRSRSLTENVVDLLVGRLKQLAPRTRVMVELAASAGTSTTVGVLAVIGDRSASAVHDDLRPAVREGLLLRQDDLYCFPHDRVRQAAYSLIEPDQRAGMHLRIGRLLHPLLGQDPPADAVFEVLNHLNLGAAGLDDPQERITTARLGLLAADKARAAAAFAAALTHASFGASLLPPEIWASEHELAFGLSLHQAEGEIIAGNLAGAEVLATDLLTRAANRLERAKLHRLLVDLHTRRGSMDLALDSASQCLALYDVELPVHPSAAHVQAHEEAMLAQMAGHSLEELRQLPRRIDPDLEAAMNVLAFILPTAYFTDVLLHRLVAIHLITLTLRHGVMPASPMGFAAFGFELNISERHAQAEGLGRLACDLVERHGFAASRAMVHLVAGATTNAFSQPHRTSLVFFREALRAGLEVGDLLFASLASQQLALVPHLTGSHLDEVVEQAQAAIDFNRKARVPVFIPMLASIRNLAGSLRDRRTTVITNAGPDVDAEIFEQQIAPATLPVVTFGYYLAKTAACIFGDDAPGALAAAETLAGLMPHARGQLTQIEAHVLRRWPWPAPWPNQPATSATATAGRASPRSAGITTSWPAWPPTVRPTSPAATPWSRPSWPGWKVAAARPSTATSRRFSWRGSTVKSTTRRWPTSCVPGSTCALPGPALARLSGRSARGLCAVGRRRQGPGAGPPACASAGARGTRTGHQRYVVCRAVRRALGDQGVAGHLGPHRARGLDRHAGRDGAGTRRRRAWRAVARTRCRAGGVRRGNDGRGRA